MQHCMHIVTCNVHASIYWPGLPLTKILNNSKTTGYSTAVLCTFLPYKFAYLLGHQINAFCENSQDNDRTFFEVYRFFCGDTRSRFCLKTAIFGNLFKILFLDKLQISNTCTHAIKLLLEKNGYKLKKWDKWNTFYRTGYEQYTSIL